jgi:hypothetical protein
MFKTTHAAQRIARPIIVDYECKATNNKQKKTIRYPQPRQPSPTPPASHRRRTCTVPIVDQTASKQANKQANNIPPWTLTRRACTTRINGCNDKMHRKMVKERTMQQTQTTIKSSSRRSGGIFESFCVS